MTPPEEPAGPPNALEQLEKLAERMLALTLDAAEPDDHLSRNARLEEYIQMIQEELDDPETLMQAISGYVAMQKILREEQRPMLLRHQESTDNYTVGFLNPAGEYELEAGGEDFFLTLVAGCAGLKQRLHPDEDPDLTIRRTAL